MKNNIVNALIKKGVKITNPESVYISEDVNPDRIAGENVIIYSGCKIMGSKTLIMKNSCVGYEAPVTLENTLLGENTNLKGGFFQDAVFAGDNSFGSGAHVRGGTILEEQANAAHTVGLKHTILFPFVTLGSLINFCDCFMAGGTSRKDHSEVGSSFIHFNYTPNQDKATASMMGDVHRGVMLKSNPIFLGGQGGIVGPVKIGYGCISAAGSILRKNELEDERLLLGGAFRDLSLPRKSHVYNNVGHIFNNNVNYIANLIALKFWYKHIRSLFVYDDFSKHLQKGMQDNLNTCIEERIYRLKDFCEKLNRSKEIIVLKSLGNNQSKDKEKKSKAILQYERAINQFQLAEKIFKIESEKNNLDQEGETFIRAIEKKIDLFSKKNNEKKYIETIQSLAPDENEQGTAWLFNITQKIIEKLLI
jgi:bifunctional UDP-N-acetylglucosamine pyrophosphorylase/glucosamine-1-phosphate N-acetyltransferase